MVDATLGGAVANPADDLVESAPEPQIALDMVRRALPVAPALVVVCTIVWRAPGAAGSATGILLVLANFAFSAAMLSRAARISPTMLMAASLGGFIVRMGAVLGALVALSNVSWISLPALLLTVLVTHLGLLLWETRYVSASLAFPGLKPGKEHGR